MRAEVIPVYAPGAVERAAGLLRAGKLVAFPTDTVYGIAAHGFEPAAIGRLYQAKGRPPGKAIALLVSDLDQVRAVARDVPAGAWRLCERYWPGALTVVLRRAASVSDVLSAGGETVAVRMPDHRVALALVTATGAPLAATSANRSGNPDPVSAADVVRELGEAVDLILDGGTAPGGVPSTVVDLTVDPPVIVRPGPIAAEDVEALLRHADRD